MAGQQLIWFTSPTSILHWFHCRHPSVMEMSRSLYSLNQSMLQSPAGLAPPYCTRQVMYERAPTPRRRCGEIYPKLFWHRAWLGQNSSPRSPRSLDSTSLWVAPNELLKKWRTSAISARHLSDLPFWCLAPNYRSHLSHLGPFSFLPPRRPPQME